jgi:epoxyqueuosine reductase
VTDILLHICCGPCLIYPFSRLKERGFKLRGFYYNPNLYPLDEYPRRREGVERLSKEFFLEVEYPQHDSSDFLQAINAAGSLERPQRCIACWSLRLRKTAQAARANGLVMFSTTLLVSPHQDHDLLRELGHKIGREEGIDFYYEDFRPGFKQAQIQAKQKGIYRQKYCGCKYSQAPELAGGKIKSGPKSV